MRAKGCQAFAVDAGAIAVSLGDTRLANGVMLGTAADSLPLPREGLLAEVLEHCANSEALRHAAAFETRRAQMRGTRRRSGPAGQGAVDVPRRSNQC